MLAAYRRSGADPPWGDPRRYHGVAMEGYFWRFTQAPAGRVAIVMCAISRGRDGSPWAFVGLAAHPGRFFRWAVLHDVRADTDRYALSAGEAFSAGPDHLRVDLAADCRLEASFGAHAGWPRRALGALGAAQLVPGLSQYWHPHLFAAEVRGSADAGGEQFALDGARAYAEKNWGRGFPETWWWGQGHDFGDDISVSFAGGPVRIGPVRLRATAAVVRLDGDVLRCRPPASMTLGDGSWLLRARAGTRLVEIEGAADPSTARSLTVPLPDQRRVVDRSHHHLAGELRLRVSRRSRLLYAGESALAGLERGG